MKPRALRWIARAHRQSLRGGRRRSPLRSGRSPRKTKGRAGGRCEARLRRSRGASRGGGHERRSAHPCALLRCALNIAALVHRPPHWPCPELFVQGLGKRPPHRAWLRGCPPPRLAPRLLLDAAAPGPTHRPGVNAAKAADCGQTQAAEFSKQRVRRSYHSRACGWALRSEVKEEPRR